MTHGSQWRKWDLHLHTPCSILHNEFGSPDSPQTWERYVSEIEKLTGQNQIVALGITDYFTIEGYKRLLEYKKQNRLSNLMLISNVEFRLSHIIYREKEPGVGRRINAHVLFSPELSVDEIEQNFLSQILFDGDGTPYGDTSKWPLTLPNLLKHGERLVEQGSFPGKSPIVVGCETAAVDFNEIKKLVVSPQFKGKTILVLAEEDLSVMDWGSQHHSVRQQLIQASHAVFSSNNKSREFYLGLKHPSTQAYLDEFKSFKPCIWGCDSHAYHERFLEPVGKRYCWIKGDVTWDGLKQIMFEPEDRVAIQETCPEPQKSIFTLGSVKVKSAELTPSLKFSDFETGLNPNLVAVIGGRGSGKTALLDIIARSFRDGQKLS
jgi:hypothetical protein